MRPATILLIAHPAAPAAAPEEVRRQLAGDLSRADVASLDTGGVTRTLFRLFGFGHDGELPIGAVTRAVDAADAGGANWMRADPAWMDVGSRLVMKACGDLDLERGEADSLAAELGAHFETAGLAFSAPHPARWYLQLPDDDTPGTTPPDELAGRDCSDHLPEGASRDAWRRMLGEVQMILHNHPVNADRRSTGLPPVNSLWFFGAGRLPSRVPTGFAEVIGADVVARGLYRLPGGADPGGDTLLLADGGADDADTWDRWRHATGPRRVLVPASNREFRLRSIHRLRFWRPGHSLESLLVPERGPDR